jgi:hypothetical protein
MSDNRLIHLLDKVLGKGRPTNKGHVAYSCPFCQNLSKKKLEIQPIVDKYGETPWHCWVCNAAGKKLTSLFKALNVSRDTMSELYSALNIQPKYINNVTDENFASNVELRLPKEYIPLYKSSNSIEYKNAIIVKGG